MINNLDYIFTGLILGVCLYFIEAFYFIFEFHKQLNISALEVMFIYMVQNMVLVYTCVKLDIKLLDWITSKC